ncbi:MAG TPA: hypothetical protein PKI19_11265 [Elusimicrobiales bacterium]|nr:hypothetical protein [Elusimicrobiales bacterium]
MGITFFAFCSALLQVTVFVCYPKTGPMGAMFILISVLAWTAFFIFTFMALSTLKRTTILYINTGALLAGLLVTLVLLPQQDKISVFDKLSFGFYPRGADIYDGLKRLGIDYPALKPPEKPQELIEL